LLAATGSRPTAVRQTDYEWVYLSGAVAPQMGASSALLAPSVNTGYMNHHLQFISGSVVCDVHVILVLDQAGWHSSKGLQVPQNTSLLALPAYSPELNPVERLWQYLRSRFLSNHPYRNYDELFTACSDAWNRLATEQSCSICHTQWTAHEN
jgi:transposase